MPGRMGVVGVAVIIGVEKLFEPLHEFEIVLKSAFYQSVYRYDLFEEIKGKFLGKSWGMKEKDF